MSKKTKSGKKPIKKKTSTFKFIGRIKNPFPVEVIWDDAYHSRTNLYDMDDVESECTGPFWSYSYGKLLYASRDEIIVGHFIHTNSDGLITCIREPIRIAIPMIYKIINLRTGKTIYEKRGKKKPDGRKKT